MVGTSNLGSCCMAIDPIVVQKNGRFLTKEQEGQGPTMWGPNVVGVQTPVVNYSYKML